MARILKPACAGIVTVLLLETLLRLFAFALPPQVWGYSPNPALAIHRSLVVFQEAPIDVGHLFRPNEPYRLIDAYMLNDPHVYGMQALYDVDKLPTEIIQTPFFTDRNGLINHEPLQDTYSVLTVADSFGSYSSPVRWQEFLGVDYYDLSVSSWTFQNYAAALERFGYDKQPDTVFLMIYGGNDLHYVGDYEVAKRAGVSEAQYTNMLGGSILSSLVRYALYRGGNGRLPIQVEGLWTGLENGAFVMSGLDAGTMTASQNFAIATDILRDISARVRLVIVYAPTKEAVYWNHLSEADKRWAYESFAGGWQVEGGWLAFGDKPSYEDYATHIQDQRDTWQAWADKTGIQFVDLTPVLEGVLVGGELPYNVVDGHFSAAGHEAAGMAIAAVLD